MNRVEEIAARLDVYTDGAWALEIDLADKTPVLEQLYDSWLDADHALTVDAFGLMLAERALVGRSEDLLWRHEVRQRQKRLTANRVGF